MNEKNIVRKNNDICNRLFPIAFAILLLVALVVGVIEKNNPNEYTYVKKYESLDKYGYVEIRSRLLRKTLVENRMDNDDTLCFDTYPIVSS